MSILYHYKNIVSVKTIFCSVTLMGEFKMTFRNTILPSIIQSFDKQMIKKIIANVSDAEIKKGMIDLAKDQNNFLIFHSLMPVVTELMYTNDKLATIISDFHANNTQILSDILSGLILECICKCIDSPNIQSKTKYHLLQNILDVVANSNNSLTQRTYAINTLSNFSFSNIKVLQDIINSNEIVLINEVANVLVIWDKLKFSKPTTINFNSVASNGKLQLVIKQRNLLLKQIKKDIISYIQNNQNKSLNFPGLISFIAHEKNTLLLTDLLKKVKKAEDVIILLSNANKVLSTDQIAQIFQIIFKEKNLETKSIILGTISSNPKLVKKLFNDGHYEEVLYIVEHLPITHKSKVKSYFEGIIKNTKNKQIKTQAYEISRFLPLTSKEHLFVNNLYPVNPTLILNLNNNQNSTTIEDYYTAITHQKLFPNISKELRKLTKIYPLLKLKDTQFGFVGEGIKRNGSNKFCNPGDAIYSNGTTCHNHAGLFYGIEPTGNRIYMKGIHITGKETAVFGGHGSHITYIMPGLTSKDPKDDLLIKLNNLKEMFKQIFANDPKNYLGNASLKNLSALERKYILNTADTMLHKGIKWVWYDMILKKGLYWDGTVNDINRTRCDGLVEYVYEKNGHIVCSGEPVNGVNFPNIAEKGNESLKAHANFHDSTSHKNIIPGELCPRIQFGLAGNNTNFVRNVVSLPKLKYLRITSQMHPIIEFKVKANKSTYIYTRITVKKGNGKFRFIIADNIVQQQGNQTLLTYDSLPCGPVNFMKSQHLDRICWLGKVVDGNIPNDNNWKNKQIDFWGQNDLYEFNIEFIDQAGHVTEKFYYKVNINWASTAPNRLSDQP